MITHMVYACFQPFFLSFLHVRRQPVTKMLRPVPPHRFKVPEGLCAAQQKKKLSLKALDCLLGMQQRAGFKYR